MIRNTRFPIVFVSALLLALAGILSLSSITGLQIQPSPVMCGLTAPVCNGLCPPGQVCAATGATCVCQAETTCGTSAPLCNGPCPPNQVCTSSVIGGATACVCAQPSSPPAPSPSPSPPSGSPSCSGQPYPACSSGPCPAGFACQAVSGTCQCSATGGSSGGGAPAPPAPPANTPPSGATLVPDCSNVPHGYDLISMKVSKSYVPASVPMSDGVGNSKIVPLYLRYITIHSCNPNAFDDPELDITLPSKKTSATFQWPAEDGSTAYLITDARGQNVEIKSGKIYQGEFYSNRIFQLAVPSQDGVFRSPFDPDYSYKPSLFPSPYTQYRRVLYNPFAESMEVAYGTSVPDVGIWGSIMFNDENKNPMIILEDVPRKIPRLSDSLALPIQNPPSALLSTAMQGLLQIFDAYDMLSALNVLYTLSAEQGYWSTSFRYGGYYTKSYYGFDDLIIHYDLAKNAFSVAPGFSSPVEVISHKTDALPTAAGQYLETKLKAYNYLPPFILPSGTNVLKATENEVLILYSQKHQNRPGVTFGTLYDNQKPVPSTLTCAAACVQKASGLPSSCAPVSECKLNCPTDKAVNDQTKACVNKLESFYKCQNKAGREFDQKKSPQGTRDAYILKACGTTPCQIPAWKPAASCASRCDEEGPLCAKYEMSNRNIGCQAACGSASTACSKITFQVKLKAKTWKKVTIPDGAPPVISANEFSDCKNLKIRTLKGKKVGVPAAYLERGATYAFKASAACMAKFVPLACRPQSPETEAPSSEEPLEDPDDEMLDG